jgi:hypothetical protein
MNKDVAVIIKRIVNIAFTFIICVIESFLYLFFLKSNSGISGIIPIITFTLLAMVLTYFAIIIAKMLDKELSQKETNATVQTSDLNQATKE